MEDKFGMWAFVHPHKLVAKLHDNSPKKIANKLQKFGSTMVG